MSSLAKQRLTVNLCCDVVRQLANDDVAQAFENMTVINAKLDNIVVAHTMMAQNCLQSALARGPINTTRYRRLMVSNGPFGSCVGRARAFDGFTKASRQADQAVDQPRKGTR